MNCCGTIRISSACWQISGVFSHYRDGLFIVSLLVALLFLIRGVEINFDLAARDVLLIYFFTTIGINSSLFLEVVTA